MIVIVGLVMHTGTPVRFTSYPATTRMRRSRSNVFHQRVKVLTPQISKHSLPLHTRKVAGSIQPDDQLFSQVTALAAVLGRGSPNIPIHGGVATTTSTERPTRRAAAGRRLRGHPPP